MEKQETRKRVLVVCGGNTCRSPMAKVILEQKLKARGKIGGFEVDTAAYDAPTSTGASPNAREAIKKLLVDDLLASHKAQKITPDLVKRADLILVMGARMKKGLPYGKTWTLKEYVGDSGDVADPFGGSVETYISCAHEISDALEKALSSLL